MESRQPPADQDHRGDTAIASDDVGQATAAPRDRAVDTRARVVNWARWQTRMIWHWLSRPQVRQVLALFLASRAGFVLVTYVGYVLLLAPKYSTTSVGVSGLFNSWNQWDATRYLAIAAHGYSAPAITAFFPLYPMLIATLAAPFGGQGEYVIGLLIANGAFLGALFLLQTLVAERWGETTAARTLLYLTIFPTALYTFAPYNESLFLLWSIGCFVALNRRRWALAGLLGALAVLTRAAGLVLLVPFAYEWWHATRASVTNESRAGEASWGSEASGTSGSSGAPAAGVARGWRRLAPAGALAWALALPAALAGFAIFCALRFGDALAFVHAQAQWNRVSEWPWVGLWWQVIGLAQAPAASFYQVHDLLDLAATLGFLVLLVLSWRRLPRAQTLYMAGLFLLFLVSPGGVHLHTNDPLSSNQRFVLEMFPGFITLALLMEHRPNWHQGIVIVSSMLLAALSLIFIFGRWLV